MVGRRPTRGPATTATLADREPGRLRPRLLPPSALAEAPLEVPPADLDAVAAKALRDDPADRYPSADRLREDLVHLLESRPVSARPATSGLRLRRFVARHRFGSAAALLAATLVALLVGGFTLRLAAERDATRLEAEHAERARVETEKVVDFLAGLFRSSDPYAPVGGKSAAQLSARDLLDRSAERLRGTLVDQPLVRARLLYQLGRIYRVLGLLDSSDPLLRESLRLRETTPGADPADLAASRLALARDETQRGRFDRAAPLFAAAVAGYRRLGDRRGLAGALEARGQLELSRGEAGAVATFRESLSLWQALGVAEQEGHLRLFLANALARSKQVDEAREQRQRALELFERTLGPDHPLVGEALVGLADIHKIERQQELSIPLLERALKIFEKSFGVDDFRVATAANNLGVALMDLGRNEEARPYLDRALAGFRRDRPNHPDVGNILNNLGAIEWAEGHPAAAARDFRTALEQLRRTLPEEHLAVSRTAFNLGEALLTEGKAEQARPWLEQSLRNFRAKLGDDDVTLSWPQIYLAGIAEKRGDLATAERLFRRAAALREAAAGKIGPDDLAHAREELAGFLRRHPRQSAPVAGTSRPQAD